MAVVPSGITLSIAAPGDKPAEKIARTSHVGSHNTLSRRAIACLAQVRVAYDRAGDPKKLVVLPYDTVGLYSEPGLGVAMRHAVAWFDRHLAADQHALAEAEAGQISAEETHLLHDAWKHET